MGVPAVEPQLLPLFPLNTVLFPGMPLRLHIFEDRYRLMIGECTERQQPFGVVLIKAGQEVGAPAEPREVGTTAHIAALSRLDDGRMNLVAVGQQRFRIEELIQVKPYLVGRVTMLADEREDDLLRQEAEAMAPALKEYLSALFAMLDQQPEPFELPSEPARLSYVAASVLQVGLEDKQLLLESPSTRERLQCGIEILRRESEKLATVLDVKKRLGTVSPLDSARLRNTISPN
jgi:Lon protease-like protein